MTRKHVGIDFHASTTSQIAIRDQEGKLLFDPISVETKPEALLTAVRAISGEVHVTFEAGTGSAWLRELLEPHVKRVVVCHAADNKRDRGNKTDKGDAADLARRLWLGELTEVYQGPAVQGALKELVHRYQETIEQVVRTKNQIKAIFRKRGISCGGSDVYSPKYRKAWLEKLDRPELKLSARQLLERLDLCEKHRETNRKAMAKEARSHEGWRSVSSLPGFGPVRTSIALGIIGTPWRFPGKRQLWRYSRLAVVVHDSRQWVSKGPGGIVQHREQITRGLNRDGRPDLKGVFKGAAQTAISNYPEVNEDFEVRCQEKHPDKARLDIARKLASQLLTLWKRKEEYNPQKARWKKWPSGG